MDSAASRQEHMKIGTSREREREREREKERGEDREMVSLTSFGYRASVVAAQEGALLLAYHPPSAAAGRKAAAVLVAQSNEGSSCSRRRLHCCVWAKQGSCNRLRLRVLNVASKLAKSPADEDWKIKRETLLKNKVRSVSAKEALRLQQDQGYIILDVRPILDFKEAHPKGALNVEIYRLIKEWTPWDIARRLGFAFFGIFAGTEENPNFLTEVTSQLDPTNSKVIVACSSGGTMKPSPSLSEGQQSRSLIAAYILVVNGYKNVLHLEGGLRNWFKEELPTESSQ
ncbi:hypothetical protein O6H91_07G029000 [Diphasiastrum complanatum]|uniref:Uncharacterized protein n=1 Tax=Diphasiastrum complanatum TaxID=34168 RepID=A0ACC2D3I8_DIPCM|nr:hypothetical protein O6H91_07G029000 [Diphasiastrum complanatum]